MVKVVKVSLPEIVETTDPITKDISKSEIDRILTGKLMSVSRNEWYQAAAVGLKPEYVLELWEHEYKGETIIKVLVNERWVSYHVKRVYSGKKAKVELICYGEIPRGNTDGENGL